MRCTIYLLCTLTLTSVAHGATVQHMVETRAEQVLGREWVHTAVVLAKKESSLRCNAVGPRTRHGRARGVFQVMPGSAKALGFKYDRLLECHYGIEAGLAHMQMCLRHGVKTERQMIVCHQRGVGGWRRASA